MYYYVFLGALLLCALFASWASIKVRSTYNAFRADKTSSNMTGYDTAVRLLRANDVEGISVEKVEGELTDHYNPKKALVNLSESTYGDDSVASVAVAAHEIGHVLQKKNGYVPYKIRTALVPLANIGSFLAIPLVLLGIILEITLAASKPGTGLNVAMIGVAAYGLSTLFTLVTLPVELDASRRAKNMLIEEGILTDEEMYGAGKVLKAAAMTYVAALATSLVYFLRFLWYVLMIFGGGKRKK
ncbi:MAG: zinc metallopeptidase [Clostridiales bacterium]|jgi:neutral zinc metallopeptidase family protein|nr:zinc metallopeptidase [Clostridiales bacterium]HAC11780.1 peptidase [Clostridiales bacterium]